MTKIRSNVSLVSEVLYSGRFRVPWHQRYYDWKVEQVRDLLHDLNHAATTKKACYFLGSIMLLQETPQSPQRINDGQQRLITFSLLTASLCRRFAAGVPRDAAREDRALRVLFDRSKNDTSTLAHSSRYHPRITPPRKDLTRYNQLIRGNNIGTNGLLTRGWKAVDDFVEAMNDDERRSFFEFLTKRVEVSVLAIPNDVDANLVFETLNARGKRLDDVDLIRNRLYSYFPEEDDKTRRDTVHSDLENIGLILRTKSRVPEYYRCYLQCTYGFLKKMRFYREARMAMERAHGSSTGTELEMDEASDYVYDLIRGLGRRAAVELFRTIVSGRASQGMDRRLPKVRGKRDLTTLLSELQRYKVSHPLCFALLHRFVTERSPRKRSSVHRAVAMGMKDLTSFVMRNVFVSSQFRPSRFEPALANLAAQVFNGDDVDSIHIVRGLEECDRDGVMENASFIRRLSEMEFRDVPKALRVLFGINQRKQPGSDVLRVSRCSVEHILPRARVHWKGWDGFGNVDPAEWVHRLGNLVVMSGQENRGDAKFNGSFDGKRAAFRDSAFAMARDVAAEFRVWTPETVEKRSKRLAKEAAAIWCFSGRR